MTEGSGVTEQQPPSGYRWYVVGLLLAISVIGYADRLILGFLVEPIKAELGLSDTEIGLVTGLAFALLYVIMGVPIGRLIDSGRRIVVIASCIGVWSLCTITCGAAQGFLSLFAARIGVGAGEAGLNPGAVSLIGDYFPPDQVARPIGIFSMGIYLGGGIALILGGPLATYFGSLGTIALPYFGAISGWRLVFVGVGLPGLLAALLFLLTIRDPIRHRGAFTDRPTLREALGRLRGDGRLLVLLTAAFVAFGFNIYAVLGWYPAMLIRSFGIPPSTVSFSFGPVYLVFGTAGALLLGPLTHGLAMRGHRDAPVLLCLWAMVLNAAASIAAPLMPGLTGAIICAAVVIISWALIIGSAFTIIAALIPADLRGLATGLFLAIMNLTGGSFGTVLVGLLADHHFGAQGLHMALATVAALFTPFALLFFWCARAPYRAKMATTG